jgi:hypothetical protein
MEPSARFERAAFSVPRRRSVHWSYEGMSWGSAIRTRISDFKDLRDSGYPIPHHEPRAGLEPAASEVQAPRSGQMS